MKEPVTDALHSPEFAEFIDKNKSRNDTILSFDSNQDIIGSASEYIKGKYHYHDSAPVTFFSPNSRSIVLLFFTKQAEVYTEFSLFLYWWRVRLWKVSINEL